MQGILYLRHWHQCGGGKVGWVMKRDLSYALIGSVDYACPFCSPLPFIKAVLQTLWIKSNIKWRRCVFSCMHLTSIVETDFSAATHIIHNWQSSQVLDTVPHMRVKVHKDDPHNHLCFKILLLFRRPQCTVRKCSQLTHFSIRGFNPNQRFPE